MNEIDMMLVLKNTLKLAVASAVIFGANLLLLNLADRLARRYGTRDFWPDYKYELPARLAVWSIMVFFFLELCFMLTWIGTILKTSFGG